MEKTIDSLRIAQNIKKIRLENFMTQEDMAMVLGYSERQIRRLETNGTYNLYVISLIAETFDVEITDILFGMS